MSSEAKESDAAVGDSTPTQVTATNESTPPKPTTMQFQRSASWKQLIPAFLLGVTLAMFSGFLVLMNERPVTAKSQNEYGTVPIEQWPTDGHVYNVVDFKAPAASGFPLNMVAYLVAKSPLSPWILRHMLDRNKVYSIRELVASTPVIRDLPPTHFPVHRASWQQVQEAREWYHANARQTLQRGSPYEISRIYGNEPAPGYRSVREYHRLYRLKIAKPSDVMERLIGGVEQDLKHVKMFASFRPDDIRRQALASDERWASGNVLSVWDGVPVAIKDMSGVAGHRLCDGSSECREMLEDDFPAERFRKAGAILVGTTITTEGGVTPLGYAAFFDGPFNPYNTEYYPGGSSSGSAVAVATGIVPVAIGWDGGGSIRLPASMSGVEGLATTFGRIPFQRNSVSTNVKAGPLAATMTDIALSYLLLSEPRPGSFHTDIIGEEYLPQPTLPPKPDKANMTRLDGVRLGVFWDHFRHTDPEVYDNSLKAVQYLEQQGAVIVPITIPYMREIHLSHNIKIASEFGITWESRFYNKTYRMEPNTDITVAVGRAVTADEVLAAERVRHFAVKYVRENLFKRERLDAIVSPMMGVKVPKVPTNVKGYGESNIPLILKVMRYAPMANFLGLPGLSVPIGYEQDTGLPIGFQVLGDAWSESFLIRIGVVLELFQQRRQPPAGNFFDNLQPWMDARKAKTK
jgi:Asp-tRNA(Asn)/Glu-tRNA(Gln) amidotransferase A subunit family amidase